MSGDLPPPLFPALVPKPKRRRKSRQPDEACCGEWAKFRQSRYDARQRVSRVEGFVHQLSHNRTPFSLLKLTELAGCSEVTAGNAIRMAQRQKWIVRVPTYGVNGTSLYRGVL